jgi:tetratricopeptide (TPR) repeat protein
MRIQAAVVVILSVFTTVSLGAAQDSQSETAPGDEKNAAVLARTHFDRGVEHYSEGNYGAALAEFQRSYELSPTYKLLFNLAQVQMELHDYAAALRSFNEYLRSGGAAIAPERVSALQQEIKRLEERTAELTIDVDVTGAQISVNAVPMGVSPVREALRVNVGNIALRVEKAGFAPFEQSLSVAGADQRRVTVELKPLATAPASLASRPAARSLQLQASPNMTPAWISLGGALVLGGAAATFGVLSMNARDQQNELLARYPGRPGELDAARGRLQTFAALTDAFAAASVVAGIVGLYFLWSPPERRETQAAGRPQLRLAATPMSVTLAGAF